MIIIVTSVKHGNGIGMTECEHDWVDVVTYKQIYRICVMCNEKNIKNGDKWELHVRDNMI